MLESSFILFIILAFISTVIAVQWKSIVISAFGMLFGILIMAGHLMVMSNGTEYYEIYGLPLSFFFIIVNIILIIVNMMDFQKQKYF